MFGPIHDERIRHPIPGHKCQSRSLLVLPCQKLKMLDEEPAIRAVVRDEHGNNHICSVLESSLEAFR